LLSTVCIISDKAFISGGQAKVAIDTARLLAGRGFRVIFFAPVGPIDPSLAAANVEVECLGQSDILNNANRAAAIASGLWNHGAARALNGIIAGLDPETTVLHCHGFAKALSPAIGRVLAKTDIASLFTMHEYFLACPNGGFYDYRRQEICERRPLGASCLATDCDSRSRRHKAWRVIRQAVTWGPGQMPRGLRNFAYLSKIQIEAIRPYLPETANLYHLPNPVPAPSDNRQANPAAATDFIFVGRLSPEKGPREFAAAARKAKARAVFVGEGPERDAILDANPDAKILGWKSPQEVEEIMLGARALVFPSLWYETFGLVAYEALGRGLPVVVGRRNAASEAVMSGKNGIVLDRVDVSTLASALEELSRDDHPVFEQIRKPENRPTDGEDQYVERLLDIYRAAMEDRKRRASGES
jgi:glycosyltransferase involved in cell wall biosynthesis